MSPSNHNNCVVCRCGWLIHHNGNPFTLKCPQCWRTITNRSHVLAIGDIIATITHYTGIAWLTKRLTRGKCGCDKRQARLNTLGSRLYAKAMSLWSYRR